MIARQYQIARRSLYTLIYRSVPAIARYRCCSQPSEAARLGRAEVRLANPYTMQLLF